MVQVKAVPGTFRAAHTRHRPVEAVAEPVGPQHQARDPKPGGLVSRQRVRHAGTHGAEHAERGEMIRAQAAGDPSRQALEQAPLEIGEHERHVAPAPILQRRPQLRG